MQICTDGLIIMEKSIGESDRLITILTRDEGVIRAFARGTKNLKNKNSSATQLLSYSDLVIFKGRDKYIINEAQTKNVFFSLRTDIEKLALAQYFCELTLALAPQQSEAGEFLRLILNSLYYLSNGEKDKSLIKAVFEMRIMSLSGYMPDLVCCNACNKYEDEINYFIPQDGLIYCSKCYNKNDKNPKEAITIGRGALTALRHSIYSDFNKIFSFSVSDDTKKQFSYSAERYVVLGVDRKFNTLDFYHSIS